MSQSSRYHHPPGLWVISIMGMLYCFGFVIINSTLVLYAKFNFGYQNHEAFLLSASYNSLLFTAPLLGGFLSEKTGYRRSLLMGPILAVISFALLAIGNITLFYLALGFFVTGTAYFVPSMYVMLGKLYAKDAPKRDSAFTLLYIIINFGFFTGGLLGGYLHIWFNYRIEFLIAMATTLMVFPTYFFLRHLIKPIKGRITESQLNVDRLFNWLILLVSAVFLVGCCSLILNNPTQYDIFLISLVVIVSAAVCVDAIKRKKVARAKLFLFLILSYFSIGFWTLYSMEPALLTVFIQQFVNKVVFSYNIPPSSFYALNSLFVIIFGAILSYIWIYLDKIKRNPSLPMKFSLSLLIMSGGFFVLVFGLHLVQPTALISPLIIVMAYVLFSVAELLISPIGTAMVDQLAPEGSEGRLMGVWQLFTGVAGALAGILSQLAIVPKNTPAPEMHAVYSLAFIKIGSLALLIAVLSLILRPYLVKLLKPAK